MWRFNPYMLGILSIVCALPVPETASYNSARGVKVDCNQITYPDKGTGNPEYCFRLCNPGGGQQKQCENDCKDFLKCKNDKEVHDYKHTNGVNQGSTASAASAGIAVSAVGGVLLLVAGGVAFVVRRRRQITSAGAGHTSVPRAPVDPDPGQIHVG